jgi:biopolymer transport protein ExbD
MKPEVLRIDIDPAGTVLWNGEAVPPGEPLEQRMQQAAAQPTQPEVHIRPDRKARYDVVAGVLASAQRIGLTRIGIVGSEQFVP